MRIVTADAYLKEEKATTSTEMTEAIDEVVLNIIRKVRADKDKALYDFTEKYDGVKLEELLVTEEEKKNAKKLVDPLFFEALVRAKENIEAFHREQKEKSWFVEKENGIMLGQKITPLEKVGVYIPGGKAAYPSTVLMNVIPAKIAGVPKVVMTTPLQPDGTVNPYVLAAADLVGVDTIYKIGGVQAIAALAYGTETVERVDKIVGPGNAYVARAKKWVYGDVGIDMIAGPSEICVVADDSAPAPYVAADLLSQAEHDESARAICITTSAEKAKEIKAEAEKQAISLERYPIIKQSLQNNGMIIIARDMEEAMEIVNNIAPEHLELMVENPERWMHSVKNAGAIFLGNFSPEPLGDYFAGPNHTLPTNGTARFASPLGVYDFVKRSSIIRYSEKALLQHAEKIEKLAFAEGLTAHGKAIAIRKDDTDAPGKN